MARTTTNGKLLPYLKGLEKLPNATPRQKIISEVLSGVARTRVDPERNLLDVLDGADQIHLEDIDDTHIFALSQVYRSRAAYGRAQLRGRAVLHPLRGNSRYGVGSRPRVGETVYDPCCGMGGFLAQAYEYIYAALDRARGGGAPAQVEKLKRNTFYEREL